MSAFGQPTGADDDAVAHEHFWIGLALVLGFALRLLHLAVADFDSDQAVFFGLMSKHILSGEYPLF